MNDEGNHKRDPSLAALVRSFKGRRCLVIGDVMLDVFERGRAERLAPDTPAPVVTDVRKASSPGGAANVAANLAALGAEVTLLGVVGDDPYGAELLKGLDEIGVRTDYVLCLSGRATVMKKRLVAGEATLARVDSGDKEPLMGAAEVEFAGRAAALAVRVEVDPRRVDAGAIGEALRGALGVHTLAVTLAEEGVVVVDSAGATR